VSLFGLDSIALSRRPIDHGALLAATNGENGPFSRVWLYAQTASTNTDMASSMRAATDAWPHLSAIIADHQTAGRGRDGRTWETPAGAAVTISIAINPKPVHASHWGWFPLVVGLATVRAMRNCGADAWLKWPNDVVVPHAGAEDVPGWGRMRKVAGILCEAVPQADRLIAGVGINVSQDLGDLPVRHATSLSLLRANVLDRVEIVRLLGVEISHAIDEWRADAPVALTAELTDACLTIGSDVTVDMATGESFNGRGLALAADGALVLDTGHGRRRIIHSGDVHLRTR